MPPDALALCTYSIQIPLLFIKEVYTVQVPLFFIEELNRYSIYRIKNCHPASSCAERQVQVFDWRISVCVCVVCVCVCGRVVWVCSVCVGVLGVCVCWVGRWTF